MAIKITRKKWDGIRGSIYIMQHAINTYFKTIKHSKTYFIVIMTMIFLSCTARTLSIKYYLFVDSNMDQDRIMTTVLIFIIAEMAEVIFSALYDFLIDKVFVKIQVKMASDAFKNILYDEGNSFDLSSGKIQYCIREGSISMAELIKTLLFCIVYEIIQQAMVFAFTLQLIGAVYTFVIVGCLFFLIVFHIKITSKKIFYKRKYNRHVAESENVMYESFLNYDTVRSSCTEKHEIGLFEKKCEEIEKTYVKHTKIENVLFFSEEFMFSVTKCLMMVHFIWNSTRSTTKSVGIRAIIAISNVISTGVTVTGRNYKRIVDGIINTKLILDFLADQRESDKFLIRYRKFNYKIEFNNVSILTGNTLILGGINFTVFKGQKVALCSRNSTGKTTMLKTLLKMNEYRGKIIMDGIPIDSIKTVDYRSLFFYMPQENHLFNNSVMYNIKYGAFNISDEVVFSICKKINIFNLISDLPNGFETNVGERGKFISGGFRQRIIIARALVRNTPICIFDEPFNNLDEESQENFLGLIFSDVFVDKTVFVTIHDLKILSRFERVIDLSEYSSSILEKCEFV